MSALPTGVIFYDARAKPLSTTGGIQPGAYYQFYTTQTLTPANVYADGSLATPLSQTPGTGATTAASDGRLPVMYLNPAITYRYQLYSSVGVLLEDVDPFIPVGSTLYSQTDTEIAAGITPTNFMYAPPDVRRYGAVFGGTDSTTAFSQAKSANGGKAYVPYGISAFTTTSAITNIGLFGPGTVVAGGVTLNPNSIEKGTSRGRSGGNGCTAWGVNALASNGVGGITPGNNNTAFGDGALAGLSGGASNPSGSTAVGQGCLPVSNGATNTAVGANAMGNDITGTDNTAIGAYALFSETSATGNNCFGFNAGYSITGNGNDCYGNYAGWNITSGGSNICIGGSAGYSIGTGSSNVAIGVGALQNAINSGGNVAIGYFAGNHANAASEFYLDNQDRGSNVNEVANAPIYGNFGAAAANNRLRFNAQLSASVGTLCSTNTAPTITSASTISPTTAITFVSGTTTVTAITTPSWMSNGGRITLIPTGIWTWTAAVNIALAGTAVVNKALDFIWDAGTSKWYPSYIA